MDAGEVMAITRRCEREQMAKPKTTNRAASLMPGDGVKRAARFVRIRVMCVKN